jgi:hypothetical protein
MAARSCSRSSGSRPWNTSSITSRQVGREVGEFVGVELLGRGPREAGSIDSMSDSRTASETSSRISPSRSALTRSQTNRRVVQRQRFEDVGDVGRVQAFELVGQLVDVLLVHQAFHQVVLGHVLTVSARRRRTS